jgi:hypothetical protein
MFVKDEHYKISSKKDDKVFYGLFDSIIERGQDEYYYYFYCVDLYDKNRNFVGEIDHLYLTLDEIKEYNISIACMFSESINF